MIRLSDIKIAVDNITDHEKERQALKKYILSKLKIKEDDLIDFTIYKKSVDARKKDKVYFVYTLDMEVRNEQELLKRHGSKVTPTSDISCGSITLGSTVLKERPVIIGMGPAGLFAGLMLAQNGYRPVILERGDDVDTRTAKVNKFWDNGLLDTESNVQFGEGGAGTFSDGKLTTLINDKRCRRVLKEFINAGAPQEILYKSKPHIGTDVLKKVVKNIRNEIISYGGEVRFRAKVTDFIIENGNIKAVIINENEELTCSVLILAIGHSARDTYEVLHSKGITMTQKPFSIGVRIEHPQEFINKAQYGDYYKHPFLGAADYKLVYHSNTGRSAYTFCMCPGGYVVAAASEEGYLVTNGMSESQRDGINANSALLVGVKPGDYGSDHPLAGVEFQRKWERLAYQMGGGNYKAPVQLAGDFLRDRPSNKWGGVQPTYKPGVIPGDLRECLPEYVVNTLKEAIIYFDTKIKGFANPESLLTGVETRSSSPVRINRDENFESNIGGIYPIGEGAGYAGGIMSSAVDGIKLAEKIMAQYAPFK